MDIIEVLLECLHLILATLELPRLIITQEALYICKKRRYFFVFSLFLRFSRSELGGTWGSF